jgi:tRNA modification GTPase
VTVIDTAGIRETADPVEREGVRRARARAAEADLVLWLVDAPSAAQRQEAATPVWTVRNKIDLDPEKSDADFAISADRGDGIPTLISALVVFAQGFFGSEEGGLIIRDRQRKWLQQTVASLQRSILMLEQSEELAAEDLRAAATALGRLLGRVDVEDILDVIFRQFCIGK